ncbi:MAG: hypothetical protein OEX14_10425 [Paracoccaceae bacterium]|nr:hypothetical protein [Paracoccaceae bacterium]
MNRRSFLIAAFPAAFIPRPVLARDVVAEIRKKLKSQGYLKVEVSRTLLGRTRIIATNASFWREIIVNPRTGEVLRDYQHLNGDAQVTDANAEIMPQDNSGTQNDETGSNDYGESDAEDSDGEDDDEIE